VVSFTTWPLHPQGKSSWYPLDRRVGGPQSPSGHGDEKNSMPLPGHKPPIIQPVAQHYMTELQAQQNSWYRQKFFAWKQFSLQQ